MTDRGNIRAECQALLGIQPLNFIECLSINRLADLTNAVYLHLRHVKGWPTKLRAAKSPFTLLQVEVPCDGTPCSEYSSSSMAKEGQPLILVSYVVPVRMQDNWNQETYASLTRSLKTNPSFFQIVENIRLDIWT